MEPRGTRFSRQGSGRYSPYPPRGQVSSSREYIGQPPSQQNPMSYSSSSRYTGPPQQNLTPYGPLIYPYDSGWLGDQKDFVKLLKLKEYGLPDLAETDDLKYVLLGEYQNPEKDKNEIALGSQPDREGYRRYRNYEALGDAIWGMVVQHLRFEYGLTDRDLGELGSNERQGELFRNIGACKELPLVFQKYIKEEGRYTNKAEGYCSGRLEAMIGLLYSKLTSSTPKTEDAMYLITHWLYNILGLREIATSKFHGIRGKTARNLDAKYESLKGIREGLRGEYKSLQKAYEDLQGEYKSLQKGYEDLQKEYKSLREEYEDLQKEYKSLREEYKKSQQRASSSYRSSRHYASHSWDTRNTSHR